MLHENPSFDEQGIRHDCILRFNLVAQPSVPLNEM